MNRWCILVVVGILLGAGSWLLAEPTEKATQPDNPLLEELIHRVERLQKQQDDLSRQVDRILENQGKILEELERIRLRA